MLPCMLTASHRHALNEAGERPQKANTKVVTLINHSLVSKVLISAVDLMYRRHFPENLQIVAQAAESAVVGSSVDVRGGKKKKKTSKSGMKASCV